jgi:hypothetical protein
MHIPLDKGAISLISISRQRIVLRSVVWSFLRMTVRLATGSLKEKCRRAASGGGRWGYKGNGLLKSGFCWHRCTTGYGDHEIVTLEAKKFRE